MVEIGRITPPGPSWPKRQKKESSNKKHVKREHDKQRDRDRYVHNDADNDHVEDDHFDGYA